MINNADSMLLEWEGPFNINAFDKIVLPKNPGVYISLCKQKKVGLYAGSTRNLYNRIYQHYQRQLLGYYVTPHYDAADWFDERRLEPASTFMDLLDEERMQRQKEILKVTDYYYVELPADSPTNLEHGIERIIINHLKKVYQNHQRYYCCNIDLRGCRHYSGSLSLTNIGAPIICKILGKKL